MSLGPGNKAQFGQIVIFGSSDFNMLGDDLVLGLIEQLVKISFVGSSLYYL